MIWVVLMTCAPGHLCHSVPWLDNFPREYASKLQCDGVAQAVHTFDPNIHAWCEDKSKVVGWGLSK